MNNSDYYHPEILRTNGHELIDFLTDSLRARQERVTPAFPYQSPEALVAELEQLLARSVDAPISITELFESINAQTYNNHSPFNMGHQVSVATPAGILLGLHQLFYNASTAVYDTSLVSNAIDKVVTDWLSQKIGFDNNAAGILTTGATLGNLTALLTARAHAAPHIWKEGNADTKLCVLVSEQAHYCIDKAVRVMGLGDEGIVRIPTTHEFQMDIDALKTAYHQAISNGMKVIAVVGSACSTSTGSFDNLRALGEFCRENNVWFHVDAAHGGSAIFSEKYKKYIDGIDLARSVVIDFHKMLMAPNVATAVLYRNAKDSYATFSEDAKYLFTEEGEEWYNYGKRTYECTKPSSGIYLYGMLAMYGESFFSHTTDYLYDLGREFGDMIVSDSDFELATEPSGNIVCFRYKNLSGESSSANKSLRTQLLESKKFYITSTVLRGEYYLRVAIMNPLTTVDDMKELLKAIKSLAGLV